MSTPSNFDHVRTTKEIKQLVYDIAEKLDAAAWQIAKLLLEWQETFVCDDPRDAQDAPRHCEGPCHDGPLTARGHRAGPDHQCQLGWWRAIIEA